MSKYPKRPWMKVRLTSTREVIEALNTVNTWRRRRGEVQYHLVRAIRLYAALLRGDNGVLCEYFPFLASGGATRPGNVQYDAPQVTYEQMSEEAKQSNFISSLGITLSFGEDDD